MLNFNISEESQSIVDSNEFSRLVQGPFIYQMILYTHKDYYISHLDVS